MATSVTARPNERRAGAFGGRQQRCVEGRAARDHERVGVQRNPDPGSAGLNADRATRPRAALR